VNGERCPTCLDEWDATRVVCCPSCLAKRWLATPNLIREKHDPGELGTRSTEYRSVVTSRLIDDLALVLIDAATNGAWFYDTHYRMLVHVTPTPLGRAPGAGIPAGQREPDHALDCLFIAEADSAEQSHVFAVDGARHQAQVRAGAFEPLGGCDASACVNLEIPLRSRCSAHLDPPVLRWPDP
jgi:hypothetical protein